MSQAFHSLPSRDEIEVTLIGTGGGYGESILLKFGENNWTIVDSCLNPSSNKPLSIEYLEKIGVDIKNDVKKVICTHWHNDHILGMAQTLKYCEKANFIIPMVADQKKFLHFIGLDSSNAKKGSFGSTEIFKECLTIMSKRTSRVVRSKCDQLLCHHSFKCSNNNSVDLQLWSLSPSESVIAHFDIELSELIKSYRPSKRSIPEKSANEKSIVLLLKYKEYSTLLGADLEVNYIDDEGWHDIVNNSQVPMKKSLVYKIPHHGSENGYDKDIFETLVENNAYLKLSPWNRNKKLPQPEMIDVYKGHTDKLYITSAIKFPNKQKNRPKSEEKLINLFSKKVSEVKFDYGIIRTRHNLINDSITLDLDGNAFQI